MDALTLVLLLIAAVLVSSVVEQLVPRVSLPLIQIAFGVIVAVALSGHVEIALDPNLFLVLLIAPLLYDEAKNTNKLALWRHINPVLSLAIGLVVVTTLIVGFAVNFIIPSIPLAVAFALGAALSPTDVVAVTSLAKQVDIPERERSILESESMLNDATGIVSFQFALAAAVTGAFSIADASVSFAVSFAGGIALGLALGVGLNLLLRAARNIGVESTTFHVLFEVLTPFIVYLAAVSVGVSGIIAVMMAGLTNVISPRTVDPSVSRMNIVSSSVWRVMSFAMNGIVFVLLGTQLPGAMRRTWDDVTFDNGFLIVCVFGIVILLYAVRFLWILGMEWRRGCKEGGKLTKADVKLMLVSTLCGAKGTITLSVLLSLPYAITFDPFTPFPQRDLVIFLACGVILCTLLVANFVVPLLAPRAEPNKSEEQRRELEAQCQIDIFRNVIEELASRQNEENRDDVRAVIATYNTRITNVKDSHDLEDEPNLELKLMAIRWEQERALELLEEGKYPSAVGYRHLARLTREEQLLQHEGSSFAWLRKVWVRGRSVLRRGFLGMMREVPGMSAIERIGQSRSFQLEIEDYAAERLESLITDAAYATEDAVNLLMAYKRSRDLLTRELAPAATFDVGLSVRDARRMGLSIELDQIQQMLEEKRLSRSTAKRMRENVRLMQMDLEDSV